ncbi:MAG: glycosyltransferase family 2 protein [Actinobacteria bacterium]|nr:glycosyltransferase family 2 protein [Actinomycetota bacterium]
MKLVQTLVVRDEADIVDAQIAYHLNAGVDFVLATDNESQDGTTEILRSYERDGHLHLIRERGEVQESGWRTRMARLAATEFGADWVINTDADEFWMPREGALKEALAAVPEAFGVVWALTRQFVPRADDGRFFAERMTVRLTSAAPINDPTSLYRPSAKAAHRADPDVVVIHGGHSARARLPLLRNWYPADVFHFPYRTLEQYERKNARRAHGVHSLGQYVKGLHASDQGRLEEAYLALVVDDSTLARGVAAGCLVADTRLRDALRVLRGEAAASGSVRAGPEDKPAVDAAALLDANLVRFCRGVDDLRARVATVEERARRTRRLRRRSRSTGKTAPR